MKCPFGKECEDCHLNTKMYKRSEDGEPEEIYRCALAWTPIIMAEVSDKLNILINQNKETKEN